MKAPEVQREVSITFSRVQAEDKPFEPAVLHAMNEYLKLQASIAMGEYPEGKEPSTMEMTSALGVQMIVEATSRDGEAPVTHYGRELDAIQRDILRLNTRIDEYLASQATTSHAEHALSIIAGAFATAERWLARS